MPLVILAMLLVVVLTAATQQQSWRATRTARGAFNGTRALLAADEALARTIARWDPDAIAQSGIGATRLQHLTSAGGVDADVSITRTAPLIAWLQAVARSNTPGAVAPTTRRAARALFLRPPEMPLAAALNTMSPIDVLSGARVSGVDHPNAPDDCGPWRDTASVAGLYAVSANIHPSANLSGQPPRRAPTDSAAAIASFDTAWPLIALRATLQTSPQPVSALAAGPLWRAILVADSATVTVQGPLEHIGLLAVSGNLVVQGRLHVTGLLVVRGAIDARDGQIEVDGAVVQRAPDARRSVFGHRTDIRYAPCHLQRALAAVAIPDASPFHLWAQR